jgi:hypothetical protein
VEHEELGGEKVVFGEVEVVVGDGGGGACAGRRARGDLGVLEVVVGHEGESWKMRMIGTRVTGRRAREEGDGVEED